MTFVPIVVEVLPPSPTVLSVSSCSILSLAAQDWLGSRFLPVAFCGIVLHRLRAGRQNQFSNAAIRWILLHRLPLLRPGALASPTAALGARGPGTRRGRALGAVCKRLHLVASAGHAAESAFSKKTLQDLACSCMGLSGGLNRRPRRTRSSRGTSWTAEEISRGGAEDAEVRIWHFGSPRCPCFLSMVLWSTVNNGHAYPSTPRGLKSSDFSLRGPFSRK